MALAGLTVPETALVRDAIELSRNSLEPYLFNHVMRSWLFGVVLSLGAKPAPDPELLALSVVLHDLGLSDRYAAADRFEVDGANAARAFLKARGISEQQLQIVCDVVRRKPATSFDNILRDFGSRYVDGFKTPSFADLFEGAPFSE